jgi:hypothetical protein
MKLIASALLALAGTAQAHPDRRLAADGLPCVDCEWYEQQSAQTKLEVLWERQMATEYTETLPTEWLSLLESAEMIDDVFFDPTDVNFIFDRFSDERPVNMARFFHEYGSAAEVEFVAEPGHQFTGIFAEGSRYGHARLSHCAPLFQEYEFLGRPPLSVAFKFLRDGLHSANLVTCEAPCTKPENGDDNWFKAILPTTTALQPTIDGLFSAAQETTGVTNPIEPALFFENGTAVENPVSPYIVLFMGTDEAVDLVGTGNLDFREDMKDLPPGTHIYDAFTTVDLETGEPNYCECDRDDEDGILPCWTKESIEERCGLVKLGEVHTRSRMVHSQYGDDRIMFKHTRSCSADTKKCVYDGELSMFEDFRMADDLTAACYSGKKANDCPSTLQGADGQLVHLIDDTGSCAAEENSDYDKCPFSMALQKAIGGPYQYPCEGDEDQGGSDEEGQCEPYHGTICQHLIPAGTSVYVQGGREQDELDAEVRTFTQTPGWRFMAEESRRGMIAQFCSIRFPPCQELPSPNTIKGLAEDEVIERPRLPCQSMCDYMKANHQADMDNGLSFGSFPYFDYSCGTDITGVHGNVGFLEHYQTSVNFGSRNPMWPVDTTTYILDSVRYDVPCFERPFNIEVITEV